MFIFNYLSIIVLIFLLISIRKKVLKFLFILCFVIFNLIMFFNYLNSNTEINLLSERIQSEYIYNKVYYLYWDNNFISKKNEMEIKNADLRSVENLYFNIQSNNHILELNEFKKLRLKELYDIDYYYNMCTFFKNSYCIKENSLLIDNVDVSYNNDKSPWYFKRFFFPISYKNLIEFNYPLFKESAINSLNGDKNECLYLFYGAKNGWYEYKMKLIKNLEKDNLNKCVINIVGKNINNDTKNDLINFLKNVDLVRNKDYVRSDEKLLANKFNSLESAYTEIRKNKESNFYELLSYIYENNYDLLKVNPDDIITIIEKVTDLNYIIELDKYKKETLLNYLNNNKQLISKEHLIKLDKLNKLIISNNFIFIK